MPPPIAGDRFLLALLSAFRTLVLDLDRRGVMSAEDFSFQLQQIAESHEESGDPNRIAAALQAIAGHIHDSAS